MGTKVMFLYPNERGMSTIPPSIAILSQVLKDAGHSTHLFDTTFYKFDDELALEDVDKKKTESLNFRPILNIDDDDLHFKKTTRSAVDDFRKEIALFKPDLIAVSCTETTFVRGLELIKQTKDINILNIFGGVFPTFAPDFVIKFDEIDMLCVGEGENTIVDLADCLDKGNDYSNVTNLWLKKKDGEIKKNGISRPVNINEIPTITDIGLFGEERFYRPMGGKIRRLLPVETHRGCPYTCSFCNSPSQNRLYGDGDFNKGMATFFRKRSMDLIKKEILNHIKTWKVEYIYFWADTFLAWSNKEFDEFCEMYSDVNIPFWCQTRVETINEYKLKKLSDLGLNRITFGMEHGNEIFRRDIVKRDYKNEDAIKLLQLVGEMDITFSVNNIIGFPDETRELAFDTVDINRQFNSDSVSCSIFVPFKGTELREYSESKNYISKDKICTTSNADDSLLSMPQWEKEDISRLRRVFAMYVKFPKSRWGEIEKAERDPELHAKLSEEFVETFWSSPKAKIEDDLAVAAKGIF